MATSRLTDNDVSSLAQILNLTLQYYCNHLSPLEEKYIKTLSTIMGLGFTVILVDGNLLVMYESRLKTFIRYRNFKAYPGYTEILSRAIAETISEAIYLFPTAQCHQYYNAFRTEVESAIKDVIVYESGKSTEAKRLMKLLFQKHC